MIDNDVDLLLAWSNGPGVMDAIALNGDGSSDLTARLREAITSGRFMPNERLIEAELVRSFRANRANIRIALAMLDQEGLVVRERNRGARVRLVSDQEAIEIAEARQAVETMVARQAAARHRQGSGEPSPDHHQNGCILRKAG